MLRSEHPHTHACVALCIDAERRAQVKTVNGGSETMRTTQALHAYFSVGDATAVTVGGLEGLAYLDNAENRARKPGSSDALGIQGFTDRIYADARVCSPPPRMRPSLFLLAGRSRCPQRATHGIFGARPPLFLAPASLSDAGHCDCGPLKAVPHVRPSFHSRAHARRRVPL